MAKISLIDADKRLTMHEFTDEEFAKLKEYAEAAGESLEETALLLLTDGQTSRFPGNIYIEQ